MALFTSLFSCVVPSSSSSSSRVSDDAAGSSKLKVFSSDQKSKSKAKSSSGAPIVTSYFPVNSYISRL
ncbi:hypothetical protein O6P43_001323 [Quillaja saponaria]|uniref:Uncharacterized protein n=1 Tax=Quillaja saponaria TaxID=32244 RepID=A0AAD7QIV1_QUISA|nr:hypothetical protein O6P43_001323 [Quillaja saponaria]